MSISLLDRIRRDTANLAFFNFMLLIGMMNEMA